MNQRVKLLKELVGEDLYVVDEAAVADAVLLRSMTRHTLPGVTFRGSTRPEPDVRSFRPYRGARSFRLTRAARRRMPRRDRAAAVTA